MPHTALPHLPQRTLTLPAYAKINVGLRILGQRRDGYHEIRTIYQAVSLHDSVELEVGEAAGGLTVECDGAGAPSGRENLAYQACRLWKQASGFRGSIGVRIRKRIPAGSGLGGASADAAVTILGLERLAGGLLHRAACVAIARRLGSDVPFFFFGGRALGCGRGDEVYPVWDLPPLPCLISFPGTPMPTAEAYREAGRLTARRPGRNNKHFGERPLVALDHWGPAENDFERIVFAKWPALGRLKTQLIRAGAETASLAGSGSAVFALFDSAKKLADAWNIIPGGWQKFRVRTLTRAAYARALSGSR